LYSIALHDDDGTVYYNGYVSREEKDRHLEALAQAYQCASLDLVFEWQSGPGSWRNVTLRQDWLTLLAGDLSSLSPSGREWWKRWLQPAFGRLGSLTVNREEVRPSSKRSRQPTENGWIPHNESLRIARRCESCWTRQVPRSA
jgi:hypothetical protein